MADAKYSVDNVAFRPTFTSAGKPIDVYDVTFTELSTGHTGQVQVPASQFSETAVAAAIQPVANSFAALASLGS